MGEIGLENITITVFVLSQHLQNIRTRKCAVNILLMELLYDLIEDRADIFLWHTALNQCVGIDIDLVAVDVRIRLILDDDVDIAHRDKHIDVPVLLRISLISVACSRPGTR